VEAGAEETAMEEEEEEVGVVHTLREGVWSSKCQRRIASQERTYASERYGHVTLREVPSPSRKIFCRPPTRTALAHDHFLGITVTAISLSLSLSLSLAVTDEMSCEGTIRRECERRNIFDQSRNAIFI